MDVMNTLCLSDMGRLHDAWQGAGGRPMPVSGKKISGAFFRSSLPQATAAFMVRTQADPSAVASVAPAVGPAP
jgi:hypothetical protein